MNWFEFSFDAFLIVFIVLNVVNVVLQTIKSIATVVCGKWIAAIVNAVTFGFYTIVVVFMTADGVETVSPPGEEMKICSFLWVYYGHYIFICCWRWNSSC